MCVCVWLAYLSKFTEFLLLLYVFVPLISSSFIELCTAVRRLGSVIKTFSVQVHRVNVN